MNKQERLIEFVAKEVKADELLGLVWADSLSPGELEALCLDPDPDVGQQIPFTLTFGLAWEDGHPCPCVERIQLFNPLGGQALTLKEGRADIEALIDDIELYANQDEWHEEKGRG